MAQTEKTKWDVRYTRAATALRDLRHVADYIKPADFPGLSAKIRSAIKSADGAVRHAMNRSYRELTKEKTNA